MQNDFFMQDMTNDLYSTQQSARYNYQLRHHKAEISLSTSVQILQVSLLVEEWDAVTQKHIVFNQPGINFTPHFRRELVQNG